MCPFKWEFHVKLESQMMHLKGFFASWTNLMWFFKLSFYCKTTSTLVTIHFPSFMNRCNVSEQSPLYLQSQYHMFYIWKVSFLNICKYLPTYLHTYLPIIVIVPLSINEYLSLLLGFKLYRKMVIVRQLII